MIQIGTKLFFYFYFFMNYPSMDHIVRCTNRGRGFSISFRRPAKLVIKGKLIKTTGKEESTLSK